MSSGRDRNGERVAEFDLQYLRDAPKLIDSWICVSMLNPAKIRGTDPTLQCKPFLCQSLLYADVYDGLTDLVVD